MPGGTKGPHFQGPGRWACTWPAQLGRGLSGFCVSVAIAPCPPTANGMEMKIGMLMVMGVGTGMVGPIDDAEDFHSQNCRIFKAGKNGVANVSSEWKSPSHAPVKMWKIVQPPLNVLRGGCGCG